MNQTGKPSSAKGAGKARKMKSKKRKSRNDNQKSRTEAPKESNQKFKLWAVVVVVVLAISIPLLAKVAGQRRTASLNSEQASQPIVPPKPIALPRFLDIGTTTCAPCKAMLNVMAELKQQFPGKLEVQFINVNEQRDAARQYGIRIIPAQIFYSPEGKELYRHTGFFSTKDVVAKWKELGYNLAADSSAPGG